MEYPHSSHSPTKRGAPASLPFQSPVGSNSRHIQQQQQQVPVHHHQPQHLQGHLDNVSTDALQQQVLPSQAQAQLQAAQLQAQQLQQQQVQYQQQQQQQIPSSSATAAQQAAFTSATQQNIPTRLIPGGIPPAKLNSPLVDSRRDRYSGSGSSPLTPTHHYTIPEETPGFQATAAPATTPHRYDRPYHHQHSYSSGSISMMQGDRRSSFASSPMATTPDHHHHHNALPKLETQGQYGTTGPTSPLMMDSPRHPYSSPNQLHHTNPWNNGSSPMASPLSSSRVSPTKHAAQRYSQGMYAHASPRPHAMPMMPSLQEQSIPDQTRQQQSSPIRNLSELNTPHLHSHSSSGQIRAPPHQPQLIHQQPQHHHQQPANYSHPPTFKHVRSKSELVSSPTAQNKYRRALPEGGFMSPLNGLTTQLLSTYQICNPQFNYQSSKNPRRVLTKPSEPKLNHGYDNEDSDYILYVNDILGIDEQRRYLVLDILGQGTFGQVVKCQNMLSKEIVAVKVIKNKPAYLNQSRMEVSILEHLNNVIDSSDEHNLLRLKDKFMHKEHLCLAFELLSSNLYELIKQNQFRGLSTKLVRVFAEQLLSSLMLLKEARLIHCDLKPENILLKSLESPAIKVIDFGSACHERQTVYTYIQSRFYRSPEVLFGLPYTTSIDMWSLGCICAELFLGLPIFPGSSEYNQVARITETLGVPPNWMIEMGKSASRYFEKYTDEYGRKQYKLKSRDKYMMEYNCEEAESKKYFPSTNLREIIMSYPLPRRNMPKEHVAQEMEYRASFVDFVQGLLNLNPFERWTPHQAANHPFVTEQKFTRPYVPNQVPVRERHGATPVSAAAASATTLPHVPQPPPIHVHGHVQAQAAHAQAQAAQAQAAHAAQAQAQAQAQAAQVQAHMQAQNIQPPFPPIQTTQYYNNGKPPQQYRQQPAASQAHGSTRRPRATTFGNLDHIPVPIQRATALMNAAEPIRAQPSPAYIPPPDLYNTNANGTGYEYAAQKRASQGGANNPYGEVVRQLEDGLQSYTH